MTTIPQHFREICWNGLSLHIPQSWTAVVKGKCHLIFEDDFCPVFEMRWQSAAGSKRHKMEESTVKRFQKLTGQQLSQCDPPEVLRMAASRFSPSSYSTNRDKSSLFTFLYCSECSTFFVILHHDQCNSDYIYDIFSSVQCHQTGNEAQQWTIQDFTIHIPAAYSFSHYIMKPGTTILHYRRVKQCLSIVRLTSARERMKNSTLSDLLGNLVDGKNLCIKEFSPNKVFLYHTPSLLHQLYERLRKRLPFIIASLQYDTTHDRLLGIISRDIAPLDFDEFTALEESYEIFPV